MRALAVVGVGAAGLGAVALASLLMTPDETTLLQAAVSARDYRDASRHGDGLTAPGGFALAMRALLGSGRTAAALDRIDRAIAAAPGDIALRRTRAALLGQLGRPAEQAAELDRIVRAAGRVDDIRALAALSAARDNAPVERAMLTALADTRHATDAERERLARLDAAAGDPVLAFRRLAALPRPSADAAARMMALALEHANAATLAALAARLRATGRPVPDDAAIVARLAAAGHGDVAIAYADRAAAVDPSALIVERIALLRAAGRPADAAALLDRAVATPAVRIAPADIVRIAYELDHLPAILTAADAGRITRLPAATALDLARRAAAAHRFGDIARIDRVAAADWRAQDPWLALQLARAAGDMQGVLRIAALLPPDRVRGVAEAALRAGGDRDGLRRLLLAGPGDPAARAARLDAAGFGADAERVLRAAAATAGPGDPATVRLLYRWGPRPADDALDWLRMRARTAGDASARRAWLALYADRDRPARALATLAADPAGDTTPLLLMRLALAGDAGRAAQAETAAARLLDGRTLAPADLRRIAATLPAATTPGVRADLARRLAEAGLASPRMRLDLAWTALAAHRIGQARGHVAAWLATRPDDAAALSLAGEIEQAGGAAPAARSFFARALASTPAIPATALARATLLERLGRAPDALRVVRTAPADPARRVQEARLLIATGRPAAAATLLEAAR